MAELHEYSVRLKAAALCILLCVAGLDAMADGAKKPVKQNPPKCECKHIDAMKRDIEDSKWLADAHARKAAELEAKEAVLIKRMGSAARVSGEMDALFEDYNTWEATTGKEEFMKARGYKGTISVTFDQKTNQPNPAELEAARKKMPCLTLADALTKHEHMHTEVGLRTDFHNYSKPSLLAREEEAHYRAQAAFVEDALPKNCQPPKKARLQRSPDGSPDQRYAEREQTRRSVNRVQMYAVSLMAAG